MAFPSDHHPGSSRGTPLEHDRHIVNGSLLALAAFAVVILGIGWYALTGHRPGTAAINAPALERSVPDSTTGYGGGRPRVLAPSPTAK